MMELWKVTTGTCCVRASNSRNDTHTLLRFDTKVNKIPLATDSTTVVDASLNRPGNPYTSPSSELRFREKNVLLVIDGELQEDVKK